MKTNFRHKARGLRQGSIAALSLGAALLTASLNAGASTPIDGGLSQLEAAALGADASGTTALRLPRPGQDKQAEIEQLLAQPLSLNAALRIALMNNPGLQSTLASAGLGITDRVPAGVPAKVQAGQAIVRLRAQTQQAWAKAVSAERSVALLTQARDTLDTGGELARRLTRAGNWSQLKQAREQLLLLEAATALEKAQLQAAEAREALTVLLGLWGEQARYTLPPQLPALPESPRELPDVEARAVKANSELNLAVQRWNLQRSQGIKPGADGLWSAMHDDAVVREVSVNLRSQARLTYQRYRTQHALARHQQSQLQSVRQFIHDETLLRYNGMLASVFELLTESRAQTLGAVEADHALRDFWVADAELQAVLAGAPLP